MYALSYKHALSTSLLKLLAKKFRLKENFTNITDRHFIRCKIGVRSQLLIVFGLRTALLIYLSFNLTNKSFNWWEIKKTTEYFLLNKQHKVVHLFKKKVIKKLTLDRLTICDLTEVSLVIEIICLFTCFEAKDLQFVIRVRFSE